MVEKKGLGKAIGHAFLWFGIAIVLFPLYIALVATTHTFDVLIGSTPLWFGGEFFSKLELQERAKISKAVIEMLEKNGVLEGLSETNQISLF